MSAFARKNVFRTLASTTHISKSSAKFCYFHIAIVELFNVNHALLQKNTFNQTRILQQSKKQMRSKIRENLRTANLNPKFIGSYKQKCIMH